MLVTDLHFILTPLLPWKTALHFSDQVEELFVLCGEVRLKEALWGQKMQLFICLPSVSGG